MAPQALQGLYRSWVILRNVTFAFLLPVAARKKTRPIRVSTNGALASFHSTVCGRLG